MWDILYEYFLTILVKVFDVMTCLQHRFSSLSRQGLQNPYLFATVVNSQLSLENLIFIHFIFYFVVNMKDQLALIVYSVGSR